MISASESWVTVDPSVPILTCHYHFGPGDAHALAVGGADGLIVVSPPCGATEATFTNLERHGKVKALVASNAFHNMGIAPWKARYPDAAVFAPAQSIARVEKKSKVTGIRPLADARDIAGPNVELIDMPHFKTGEVLVRVKTGSGTVWYVTDVIFNMPVVPPGFPFNLLFKLTKSAPGFRLNGVAPVFMMRDKRAVHRWLRAEAEKAPPSLVIPAHGDPARMDPPGKLLFEILPQG